MRIMETEDEAKERRRVKAKDWDLDRWEEQRERLLDGAERQQQIARNEEARVKKFKAAMRRNKAERFRKH
jgi:hypothetical protein